MPHHRVEQKCNEKLLTTISSTNFNLIFVFNLINEFVVPINEFILNFHVKFLREKLWNICNTLYF